MAVTNLFFQMFTGERALFMECRERFKNFHLVQHPNLPIIGYAWSILIRDSQGRDSFTEDALLSAWD